MYTYTQVRNTLVCMRLMKRQNFDLHFNGKVEISLGKNLQFGFAIEKIVKAFHTQMELRSKSRICTCVCRLIKVSRGGR